MSESKVKIEIYRKKTLEEFSKAVSEEDSLLESGSSAAAVGSISCALLLKAASVAEKESPNEERVVWLVRNAEILRTYLLRLVDEDVKCRNPLKRALKEGDDRRIEAARQAAVSICLEIINMMGKCLEMAEEVLSYVSADKVACLEECAVLALASSRTASAFLLRTAALSPDDTYRYVIRRENELTIQEQENGYRKIINQFFQDQIL